MKPCNIFQRYTIEHTNY